MTDLKCLTTKEVARLCRVSDATVKRWEDAGLLQSERTSGGHRRFRVEEVVRFQREQNLGLKKSHGDESVVSVAARRENKHSSGTPFFRCLIAGCEEAAANLLIGEYLKDRTMTEIFDDFVCPAMRTVGELWLKGKLTISQEHLATRTAQNSIYKLRNSLPVPTMTDKLAVCCSIEGDFHELPAYLAQVTIENEGWEVLNFGANTPFKCLAKEIFQHSPQLICLSATIITDVEIIVRDYKCFAERVGRLKIPIILGGRVFKDKSIRKLFPADFFAHSFADITKFTRKTAKKSQFIV
jgi:excisionase family DNA binding protein